MGVEYIGRNGPDGMSLGSGITELISFYGVTPTAQRASASQSNYTITATTALATATISQVGTSGKWAFASSTVALAYVARIKQIQVDIEGVGVLMNRIQDDLVALGLIKGAA
jgi:hypothetical protein